MYIVPMEIASTDEYKRTKYSKSQNK